MEDLTDTLKNIGNFKYEPNSKRVYNEGILHIPNTAGIKIYSMFETKKLEPGRQLVVDVFGFLKNNYEEFGPRRGSGLGFAILSEDVLNLCTWGDHNLKNPYVLFQKLFTVYNYITKTGRQTEFLPAILDTSGTFCAWEIEIAGHESSAWRRYLYTDKNYEDKMKYLNDFYNGPCCGYTSDSIYGIGGRNIEDLKFSVRVRKTLIGMGIRTIEELAKCTEDELLKQTGFGKTSLHEVKCKLDNMGLNLRRE